MISLILKLASLACVAALLFSFAAFARDAADDGSKRTVAQIASADDGTPHNAKFDVESLDRPAPGPRVEKLRESQHSGVREAADDVNDVLTAPFVSVAGDSIWAQRIVSGLLALIVFGVGLGYLSRVAALRGV